MLTHKLKPTALRVVVCSERNNFMTESTSAKPGFFGWINVLLLFVIYMAAFGMVYYGFSVIFSNMVTSLGWNRGTASIAQTLCGMLMGFLAPAVAFSIQKYGPKKTLIFGFITTLPALLLMGTVMSQIWLWTLLWGIVVPIGLAFGGGVTLQTILVYWFNFKRGTAMGIVMTGAAVGGFAAQPFYSWLMAHTNSWRSGWLVGAVFIVVGMICSLFVVDKPEDVGQYPDGLSPDKVKAAAEQNTGKTKIHKAADMWGVKEAFKTWTLRFYVILSAAYFMAISFIATHGILDFMDRGFSEMNAPLIFSMVLIGSAVIRFPIGMLGDKIEPRRIINASFGIMMIMLFLIWKNQSIEMIMVAGFVFGACYGTDLIMFPTMLGNYYGPDAFAGINGVMGPLIAVFGGIMPVAAGYIFESVGSYDPVYIFLICLMLMSFVISFFIKPPVKNA